MPTPAAASPRPTCRGSSTSRSAASAARTRPRTRRTAAAAGSAWPSCAAWSRRTAAGSRWQNTGAGCRFVVRLPGRADRPAPEPPVPADGQHGRAERDREQHQDEVARVVQRGAGRVRRVAAAAEHRQRDHGDQPGDGQPGADHRPDRGRHGPGDQSAGHRDQRHQHQVVQQRAGQQPGRRHRRVGGDAAGQHAPAAVPDRGDPERPEPDPPPHGRTSIRPTHFVCSTPGRFGAISRAGLPWSGTSGSPFSSRASSVSSSLACALSTTDSR